MNRFFRRLSLLLCVLLLLITALSGCGTSPAAPSGPSTPQAPTAEDEALRRAPFQPVITCELAGEAETLTEEQQQAILSYTTMLCTALARPDDPLPDEPYTTDTLRQEALTRGFLWSSYIWGEQRVQVYPMNPIYRSEDATKVDRGRTDIHLTNGPKMGILCTSQVNIFHLGGVIPLRSLRSEAVSSNRRSGARTALKE